MTTEQFTYWLQGFFEINDPQTINKEQTQIIKDHLNLVFDKVTPDRSNEENESKKSKRLGIPRRLGTLC